MGTDRRRFVEADHIAEATRGGVPIILIIDDEEWSALALESMLVPAGYQVVHARSGIEGLERAFELKPDAILLDVDLPDLSGLDVCRQLSAHPGIGPATPLIVTTADPASRRRRLDALQAGAWDFVAMPPNMEELLARLSTWIRARRAAEFAREEGFLDPVTGVYNGRGLLQRMAELAAEASRYERPLACAVFTVTTSRDGVEAAVLCQVRDALAATVRSCDAIGRLASNQFAVLAPATDQQGALRLAQRAIESLDGARQVDGAALVPERVQAGYFGVDNFRVAAVTAPEMLARATLALQTAGPLDLRIHPYLGGAAAN
jgi:PleD family two-component response regulator